MQTITGKRNQIGAEYQALCNTYDREEMAEHAGAIMEIAQELLLLCKMPIEEYIKISTPQEA